MVDGVVASPSDGAVQRCDRKLSILGEGASESKSFRQVKSAVAIDFDCFNANSMFNLLSAENDTFFIFMCHCYSAASTMGASVMGGSLFVPKRANHQIHSLIRTILGLFRSLHGLQVASQLIDFPGASASLLIDALDERHVLLNDAHIVRSVHDLVLVDFARE
jgi:hypothetical protein